MHQGFLSQDRHFIRQAHTHVHVDLAYTPQRRMRQLQCDCAEQGHQHHNLRVPQNTCRNPMLLLFLDLNVQEGQYQQWVVRSL
jgi:hypothetical protein